MNIYALVIASSYHAANGMDNRRTIRYKRTMSQLDFMQQLESFRFAILQVHYLPLEPLRLHKHPSMILRGNLGNQLLTMACLQQGRCASDGQCQQPYTCLYGKLFQPAMPNHSTVMQHQQSAPRPFIFDFPEWVLSSDNATAQHVYVYSPDKPLTFSLILIGQAISHLAHIIFALAKFGARGLYDKTQNKRVPIVLERVTSLRDLESNDGTCVFSGAVQRIFDNLQILSAKQWLDTVPTDATSALGLEFLSPTQLKRNKSLVAKPDLEVIIRGILRRVLGLSYVHCDTVLSIDHQRMIALSKEANERRCDIHSTFLGHYSKRQRQSVYLGGFYGKMTWDNVALPLYLLLKLAEVLHVGKSTVYGLGKLRVVPSV